VRHVDHLPELLKYSVTNAKNRNKPPFRYQQGRTQIIKTGVESYAAVSISPTHVFLFSSVLPNQNVLIPFNTARTTKH
jgi:hypothetical protein